jgi:protein-disulfide isomerase
MTNDNHLTIAVGPNDHAVGLPNAPLTLVEFGDYQCPYCAEAFSIVEQIREHFGDQLRFVFRNLPLVDVHPFAEAAAEVAEAAGMQGKFWEMHQTLFEHQEQLDEAALIRYAVAVGADFNQVAKDLASGTPHQRVTDDADGALRSGAEGTPTFFVNEVRYEGSWMYEPFVEYLQGVLDQI